ncbi:uncharacterized protein LOC122854950 [Aphidius gifuensis]|uniref:uncharacterized protein LOC122854950 n=1 Tax=Aphidius gifuensis TaxID=684658 RepID=UPI001CDB79F1|nr:uncharacterized protein LOC122854950 [Aphidius gifuensis]
MDVVSKESEHEIEAEDEESSNEKEVEDEDSMIEDDDDDKITKKKASMNEIKNMNSGNLQLYGMKSESNPFQMIRLDAASEQAITIYCKQDVWNSAVGGSCCKASHLARRLIEGIFTDDALMKCTYSGQPPRAQGKARMLEQVYSLDKQTKESFILFCQKYGATNGWAKHDDKKIIEAISQRLGEIKKKLRNRNSII